jgi:hypothetical protein
MVRSEHPGGEMRSYPEPWASLNDVVEHNAFRYAPSMAAERMAGVELGPIGQP